MTTSRILSTCLIMAATATATAAPPANTIVRNLAYMSPVRTSSCFDYNLTGQLITDGIIATAMPPSLTVTTRDGLLPRREREWAIDGGDWTRNILMGSSNYIQYEWTGMKVHADRVGIVCSVAYDERLANAGYSIRLLMPERKGRGVAWRVVAEQKGDSLPGVQARYKMSSDPNKQTEHDYLPARDLRLSMPLPARCRDVSGLRVELSMDGAAYWTVYNVNLFDGNRRLTSELLPNSQFGSAWMSAGEGRQWAQVDLGGESSVNSVRLAWIRRPRNGYIELSDDARQWRRVASLPDDSRRRDDSISLGSTTCRYVRVTMDGGSIDVANTGYVPTRAYVLSELEVEGRVGVSIGAFSNNGYADGSLSLNLVDWWVCRASSVDDGGETVSTWRFKTGSGWIPTKVPGTVLTSFVNYGALDDPNIADNIFNVSDSYFNSDFWYRCTFHVPAEMRSRHVLLNFDGINWKADVWLNGKKIDRIEGAFTRSQVDITPYLADGGNTLAVLIHKNAHPGAVKEKNRLNTDFNGGILGADNPTFHASTGWDWISTIRGRNIGIWNDVYLSATPGVVLSDPVVTTRLGLPADTTATMTPRCVVRNVLDSEMDGTLRGWIGDIKFEKRIAVNPGEEREVEFSPEEFPALRNRHMRLWWPNGYGEPYLYDAGFEFVPGNGAGRQAETPQRPDASVITYKAGIRQMTYADPKTQLKLYINGRRLIPLGGNWGFSEANLNYRRREYDIAVRLHRDMHFNMIRNWVGMTGDEEFYDACDRYGIMVWQDFWLANPADGPDPENETMFMQNARDFTRRMRQHPSIALYCGRNEGYPPATLDTGLRGTVAEMNPGLLYISSSADEGVSGHGPYSAEPVREYFAKQSGKLHTEKGMPNIMSPEGLARTISPDQLWPQGDAWGQHDFTMAGAQRGASFDAIIERMFGKVDSADSFARLAQWENYDGYRAMYESDSKYRQGLLIWMSHPCWPSLTWQCYDYFFEPTAAFFGARKACEPIHIQWNALTRDVEVVDRSAGSHSGLKATRDILDIHGNTVRSDTAALSVVSDTTVVLPSLHVDSLPEGIAGNVYYLRLRLAAAGGKELSSNFYVLSTDEGNLQQLNSLPEVELSASVSRRGGDSLELTIGNRSATPAMMLRLNLKTADGRQVLPVDYSDNYFHLMPGERRTVTIGWNAADAHGQAPLVELTGFNVKQRTLR